MADRWVGIDVSKGWLDACALGEEGAVREARFANEARGIEGLLRWAGEPLGFGMESTGGYERDLAVAAHAAGLPVSVENPRRVRDFARARGRLNKTDRADARAVAEYLRRVGSSPWRPEDPAVRELSLLTRHRASLLGELNRVENRLELRAQLPALVVRQLEGRAGAIRADLEELEAERAALVSRSEGLRRDAEALERIAGVGPATAALVLSEAGDVESFPSAQAYAASAGLSPCRKESGTWKGGTRISKAGNGLLRSGLFMAACVASRHNPVLKAFRERLLQRGKTKMQALVACMRKLLMVCYGVLRAVRAGKEPYYGFPPGRARP